jgi:hypothetical protein
MTTQNQTKSFCLFYLVGNSLSSNPFSTQPYQATSFDYGFDYDNDELASELSAPLPAILADLPVPYVEADEFERLYRWFNT